MEGPKARNKVMARLQTPSPRHMGPSNIKILMAINPSNTVALLVNHHLMGHPKTTNQHLTAGLQATSSPLLVGFNIKTHTEVTKGLLHCSNSRRLQLTKAVRDMEALLEIFRSRSINISKDCRMLNIQAVCMGITVALLSLQAPILIKAKMPPSHLSTAPHLINMDLNRDGDSTMDLGFARPKKCRSFLWMGFCIY